MIGRLVKILAGEAKEEGADEHQRIAVATCALLLELAHADGEFDQREQQHLEALIEQRFALSPEARDELLRLAHQQRHASVDLYAFTRLLNDAFNPAQKLELVAELWSIVFSDGTMHHHEEYLVRRICDLLHIPHRSMIEAKLLAKQDASS